MPSELLKDRTIKALKPKPTAYRVADGGNLYLAVTPKGSKLWRYKYRFGGVENMLSFGSYPDTSLAGARKARDAARDVLKSGGDPSAEKQAARTRASISATNDFEGVAREWFDKFSPKWAVGHSSKIISRLENWIFPWLGKRPIADIKAPELLACLRRIEHSGKIETAHRAMQNCGRVFRYAVATGRAERDPTGDLRGALPPADPKHHASITEPARIGKLLRDLDGYAGSLETRTALRLAPLTFVRPGELRKAEWQEFDLDAAEWRIPAARMKMKAMHVVPLSKQAVAALRELQPLTGRGRYVFPGVRDAKRPMSENTVNAALRRMDYTKDDMTGHGFRSMASTRLNEQGWHRDAIERQLAHGERDKVRAAYNYAEHLAERRRMMQAWSDYLDELRSRKDG